jgi:hypothetical protein
MKKDKVIRYENLPRNLPLFQTLVIWLVFDRLSAPGWLWGVVVTLVVLIWSVSIFAMATQKQIDIFQETE